MTKIPGNLLQESEELKLKFEDLLVAKEAMEFDDEFIFIFSEIASFEVRPQVINPPEAATLATAEEAGGLWKRPPASFAVGPGCKR